jgi:hypothetical protein
MPEGSSAESGVKSILALAIAFTLAGTLAPARAGEFWEPDPACYWCIRDAIYDRVKVIAHLEANPDIDDGAKGPIIATARDDIHRFRQMLGPLQQGGMEPCCYARPPLHVR